jgi:hypothetical protein
MVWMKVNERFKYSHLWCSNISHYYCHKMSAVIFHYSFFLNLTVFALIF